jgi:hypothetical protein
MLRSDRCAVNANFTKRAGRRLYRVLYQNFLPRFFAQQASALTTPPLGSRPEVGGRNKNVGRVCAAHHQAMLFSRSATVPKIVPSGCLVTLASGRRAERETRINTRESHSAQTELSR